MTAVPTSPSSVRVAGGRWARPLTIAEFEMLEAFHELPDSKCRALQAWDRFLEHFASGFGRELVPVEKVLP